MIVAALALALALGAEPPPEAAPGPDATPNPELARCLATAAQVKDVGRALDDAARTIELDSARTLAAAALRDAEAPAARLGLRLPFLERFAKDAEKDATRRDLAERMHFSAERLTSACKLLGQQAPAPAGADHALLVSILSRPEYELRSRDEQFLARLFQRIWTWLRDVFAESELVQQAALSTRTLFLVATCLAVAWLAWRVSRVRLARRRRPSSAADLGAVALDDPATYERAARGALERGDGREAIRGGLLSLLSTLERARLVSPGRADTNREVAEHVAARGGSPELVETVRGLVGFYDRAWYSLAPVPLEEARRFVGQARTARDEAARFRPGEAA